LKEQVIAGIKAVFRPLLNQRTLIERAKYCGQTILDAQAGNDLIAESMSKPSAVGKIGDSELRGLRKFLKHADASGMYRDWGHSAIMMHRNAGVYPNDPAIFSRFCCEFLQALGSLDILAVWFRPGEASVRRKYAPDAKLVCLTALEPYFHQRPWSRVLAGKRVVVVSPFAQTIESQFKNRSKLWTAKPEVLPEFTLRTIRAPLSAALVKPVYSDWFVALKAMQDQMASEPFDIAVVGAGAWSIPLVAHAKSLGGWGIHLGGPTQILWGVRGGRWDSNHPVNCFFNGAWVRPRANEKPQTFRQVENGCYW
jgi:hypothetical protein